MISLSNNAVALTLLSSICWCASPSFESAPYYDIENASKLYEEFLTKYKKSKNTSNFKTFKENLKIINLLNTGSSGIVFGITKFSDLGETKFKEQVDYPRNRYNDDDFCDFLHDKDIPDVDLPESFDWRKKNAVGESKDQLNCLSSYAFGAVGLLEGQQSIKKEKLLELSVQQILNTHEISDGCCGGMVSLSLKALIANGLGVGLEENCHNYEVKGVPCRFQTYEVNVTGCNSYKLQSQEKVRQLLYQYGPIAIAIRRNNQQFYKEGIIRDVDCHNGDPDHVALLVGYGTENNKNYWIVKNSWGPDWGEDGYFRIERSNRLWGSCGMLDKGMTTAVIS